MSHKNFRERIRRAVNDSSLRLALDRAARAYAQARAGAFEGLDFEALRSELRARKEASAANVLQLFDTFRREAESVGVQIYQAADAKEACRIVLDIALSHGVHKIAKAKSMLTEEIALTEYLAQEGLQVTETDLGEWICQMSGERPSHFTAPAIHKTREQIAELFSRITGEAVEPDIPKLVEVARREIRRVFLEADMGISGANIAIANSGSIVIVSNEGNARLVTSLPDVHVALVGYEKLVRSLDDATVVLKLLPRSGTGQKMTSYVSFITGPSRTSDIEKTLTLGCHGPREVHIIFVDNGRLALLSNPEFCEAFYCIKCGACLNVCPVFQSVGGHVFGHTYVGGIGAILAAFHAGLLEADEILNICATCRRCTSYCPVKIAIPDMVIRLREKVADAKGRPLVQRLVLGSILGRPSRFDKAVKLARTAQKTFFPKSTEFDNLPFPLSGLTAFRGIPALAKEPLHQRIGSDIIPVVPGRQKMGTVAFYPGCVIEHVYPEIGEAVVQTLAALGWEVFLPENQGCCGIPALLKGDAETARSLARHNSSIQAFHEANYVIIACPTCSLAIKEDFATLLQNESSAENARIIASKIYDFSQFLIDVICVEASDISQVYSGVKVTYHDPCHARHGTGTSSEPRQLLQLAGCHLVEAEGADTCCGFAGSYSFAYPEISEAIMHRKLETILATGASIVATDCPGCLIQLRGGLKKIGANVKALHTAEIVAVVS